MDRNRKRWCDGEEEPIEERLAGDGHRAHQGWSSGRGWSPNVEHQLACSTSYIHTVCENNENNTMKKEKRGRRCRVLDVCMMSWAAVLVILLLFPVGSCGMMTGRGMMTECGEIGQGNIHMGARRRLRQTTVSIASPSPAASVPGMFLCLCLFMPMWQSCLAL